MSHSWYLNVFFLLQDKKVKKKKLPRAKEDDKETKDKVSISSSDHPFLLTLAFMSLLHFMMNHTEEIICQTIA